MAVSDDKSVEVKLLNLDAGKSVTPLVTFRSDGRKAKDLQENAAWLLQTLVGATSRADSLLERVRHRDLEEESATYGHDDILIFQLSYGGRPPYKGVGANGERSAMVALTLCILMAEGMPREFYDTVQPYRLGTLINQILEQLSNTAFDHYAQIVGRFDVAGRHEVARTETLDVTPKRSASSSTGFVAPTKCSRAQGIELFIVCGFVPVVKFLDNIDPLFSEHSAWLLQLAMACDRKVKDLMQYVTDFDSVEETHQVFEECVTKVGLSEHDCGMVRLAGLGTRFLAVGCSGKRSSQLAAVMTIALQDDQHLEDLKPQIERSVPELCDPFYALIRCAVELQKNSNDRGEHYQSSWSENRRPSKKPRNNRDQWRRGR